MRTLMLIAVVGSLLALCATSASSAEETAAGAANEGGPVVADVLEGAAARIEANRKGDFVLALHDKHGRPLAEEQVEVELVRHEFLFGSNIFAWTDGDAAFDVKYRDRFEGLLNYATLPFYWWTYEPKRGETDEKHIRRMAAWCAERGIAVKGHPLVWNYRDPDWLPDDEAEVRALMLGRVDALVKGFSAAVDIWDVVNEPTDWERLEKTSPKTTGAIVGMGKIEAVKEALRRARAANPKAVLLVNDYVRSGKYYDVLDALRDDEGELLFDAVGIQAHMHRGPRPLDEIWATCERFARLGVPLHFTEVTVLSEYPDLELGERETADYVERLYTLLFSHPAVEAITWWDFSDRGAWLGAKAGLLREDGSAKPVYERLHKLIHETWTTHETLKTDGEGVVKFRGFYGTYEVCLIPGPGVRLTTRVTFTRRDPTTHSQRVFFQ
jgi:endo-1,4-beta-xylanase